jgi:uncharacterized NAD-dependent epimerase/dehydratase family protein
LVVLTEGYTEPVTAKTATCLVRYRPEQVSALLDSTQAGKSVQDVLGVGGSIPIVARLEDAPDANALAIGIAPPGGKIPGPWRRIILEAIARRMDVVSGLHEFLSHDPEFAAAAAAHGVQLIDVRKNSERDVASREGWRHDCLRIHTVGQDCSLGKMLVAVELTQALQQQGVDAKFIATGQTGIMVEGDGVPIDCVVADFLSGAIEKQILANQHREVLVIEGQGSISHPRYSAVTLGLLHGCLPHGMILCYEVGRHAVHGMPQVPLVPLKTLREVYESMANLMFPSQVIGIAMNSRRVSAAEAAAERDRMRAEFGLPVCDVIRDGPAELVDAVRRLRSELGL